MSLFEPIQTQHFTCDSGSTGCTSEGVMLDFDCGKRPPCCSSSEDIPLPPRRVERNTEFPFEINSSSSTTTTILSPPRKKSMSLSRIMRPFVTSRKMEQASPWKRVQWTASTQKISATEAAAATALNCRAFRPQFDGNIIATIVSASSKDTNDTSIADTEQISVDSLDEESKAGTIAIADIEGLTTVASRMNEGDKAVMKQRPRTDESWIFEEHERSYNSDCWLLRSEAEVKDIDDTKSENDGGDRGDNIAEEEESYLNAASGFRQVIHAQAMSPSLYVESLSRLIKTKGMGASHSPPCSLVASIDGSRSSSSSSSSSRRGSCSSSCGSSEDATGFDEYNLTPEAKTPMDGEVDVDTWITDNNGSVAAIGRNACTRGVRENAGTATLGAATASDATRTLGYGYSGAADRHASSCTSSTDFLLTRAAKKLLKAAAEAQDPDKASPPHPMTAEEVALSLATATAPLLPAIGFGSVTHTFNFDATGTAQGQELRSTETSRLIADKIAKNTSGTVAAPKSPNIAPATQSSQQKDVPGIMPFRPSTSPLSSTHKEVEQLPSAPRMPPSVASLATALEPSESLLMRQGTVWNGVSWTPPLRRSVSAFSLQLQPPFASPSSTSSKSSASPQRPRLSRSTEGRAFVHSRQQNDGCNPAFPAAFPTALASTAAATAADTVSNLTMSSARRRVYSAGDTRRSETSLSFVAKSTVWRAPPQVHWVEQQQEVALARPKPRRKLLETAGAGGSHSAPYDDSTASIGNARVEACSKSFDSISGCLQELSTKHEYTSHSWNYGGESYHFRSAQSEPRQHNQRDAQRPVLMRRMASREHVIAQPDEEFANSLTEVKYALRRDDNIEQAASLESLHVPAAESEQTPNMHADNRVLIDCKAKKDKGTEVVKGSATGMVPSSSSPAQRGSSAASTEASAAPLTDVMAALPATAAYKPESEAATEATRLAAARVDDGLLAENKAVSPVQLMKEDRQESILLKSSDIAATLVQFQMGPKSNESTVDEGMEASDTLAPSEVALNNVSVTMRDLSLLPVDAPPQPLASPTLSRRPCLRARSIVPAPLPPLSFEPSKDSREQSKPFELSLRGRRASSSAARERQSRRHERALSGGAPSIPILPRSRSSSPLHVSAASLAALATAVPFVVGDSRKGARREPHETKMAEELEQDCRRRRENGLLHRLQASRSCVASSGSALSRESHLSVGQTTSHCNWGGAQAQQTVESHLTGGKKSTSFQARFFADEFCSFGAPQTRCSQSTSRFFESSNKNTIRRTCSNSNDGHHHENEPMLPPSTLSQHYPAPQNAA